MRDALERCDHTQLMIAIEGCERALRTWDDTAEVESSEQIERELEEYLAEARRRGLFPKPKPIGSVQPTVQIWNEDCISAMDERLPDASVDLTVTSIPFEELFTYSGKPEDVGNNGSTVDILAGRFALNMRFVVDQLFRVHKPGTNVCIHIQQLLAYKNQHGFAGRRDFRGAVIEMFGAGGFKFVGDAAAPAVPVISADELRVLCDLYEGRDADLTAALARLLGAPLPSEVAICKDPQQMAQRLNLHSLQFKTGYARTSTNLAPAPNDYVLIFQKPGDPPQPVRCIKHRTNPDGWISTEDWIKWAHGTWNDILQIDVLDGWRSARESDEERHVCPLQLELIRRLVLLYTNPVHIQPDVTVLDPFMGIGSTGYVALGGETHAGATVGEPRNVVGFELKESYFDQCQRNIAKVLKRRQEASGRQKELFAVVE